MMVITYCKEFNRDKYKIEGDIELVKIDSPALTGVRTIDYQLIKEFACEISNKNAVIIDTVPPEFRSQVSSYSYVNDTYIINLEDFIHEDTEQE